MWGSGFSLLFLTSTPLGDRSTPLGDRSSSGVETPFLNNTGKTVALEPKLYNCQQIIYRLFHHQFPNNHPIPIINFHEIDTRRFI